MNAHKTNLTHEGSKQFEIQLSGNTFQLYIIANLGKQIAGSWAADKNSFAYRYKFETQEMWYPIGDAGRKINIARRRLETNSPERNAMRENIILQYIRHTAQITAVPVRNMAGRLVPERTTSPQLYTEYILTRLIQVSEYMKLSLTSGFPVAWRKVTDRSGSDSALIVMMSTSSSIFWRSTLCHTLFKFHFMIWGLYNMVFECERLLCSSETISICRSFAMFIVTYHDRSLNTITSWPQPIMKLVPNELHASWVPHLKFKGLIKIRKQKVMYIDEICDCQACKI